MKIELGDRQIELSFKKIILFLLLPFALYIFFSSFYTIDANENGVILRLGKYQNTTLPGLHLKLPIIDKVYKVKIDYQYKMEFGFRTDQPGVRTEYEYGNFRDESWMLTGDLNIAEVMWVVQYRIKDPLAYLFNVRDVENTLGDVSEAVMRLMIGDRSFQEVLQAERKAIATSARDEMQKALDHIDAGIMIQLVLLQDVLPPEPVASSFNEVNRAKQEQESAINEARQAYNKEIYSAQGEAEKLIAEAEGYAAERVNEARGNADLFDEVYDEYRKAPQVTKDRLYIETMEEILSKIDNKVIVDKNLKNLIPLMNLDKIQK